MKALWLVPCLFLVLAVNFACGGTDPEVKPSDTTTPDTTTPDTTTPDTTAPDTTAPDTTAPDTTTSPDQTTSNDVPSTPGTCPVFMDVSGEAGPGGNHPDPEVSVTCTDTEVVVQSNGIPHYTFVAITPNPLADQNHEFRFPLDPTWSDATSDIPLLGTVAVALNGVPIYGPNEGPMPDPYGDPIANAILDECMAHTGPGGDMHFHALLVRCLTEGGIDSEPPADQPSPIIAYSLDGYPIYGPRGCLDADCNDVVEFHSSWEPINHTNVGCSTSADCSTMNFRCTAVMLDGNQTTACVDKDYAWDNNVCSGASCAEADGVMLDECNGRWAPDGTYRYHATSTFPYILGCYHGVATAAGNNGPGNNPGNGPQPCEQESDCQGACPDGSQGCTCTNSPMGMICVPTCTSDADCPVGGPNNEQLTCNAQGICVPGNMGGPPN